MLRFCTLTVVIVAAAQAALATDYTYIFNGNSDWDIPIVWSPTGYPCSFDDSATILTPCTLSPDYIPIGHIVLGGTRTASVNVGQGSCLLEFPNGGTITEYLNALDKINAYIQMDGQLTVNTISSVPQGEQPAVQWHAERSGQPGQERPGRDDVQLRPAQHLHRPDDDQ
jgi:hypothetical protein